MIWIRKDKGRKRRLLSWQCKKGPGLYLRDDDVMMVGNVGYCSGNVKKVLDYTYMMIRREHDRRHGLLQWQYKEWSWSIPM